MAHPVSTAEKLVLAVNTTYKAHLVVNRLKFFGDEGRPVTMYVVKDCFKSKNGRFQDDVLFRTTSAVYLCLFMRDLWHHMQGQEIKEDENSGWEAVKAKKDVLSQYLMLERRYCSG